MQRIPNLKIYASGLFLFACIAGIYEFIKLTNHSYAVPFLMGQRDHRNGAPDLANDIRGKPAQEVIGTLSIVASTYGNDSTSPLPGAEKYVGEFAKRIATESSLEQTREIKQFVQDYDAGWSLSGQVNN